MTFLHEKLQILAPIVIQDLVRVENKGDGGYVTPISSVEEADFLISMGVNTD
jgi:hypothetical protein